MSIFKDNLLAKNQSFISTADELLNITIQTERLRATRALEQLDRVRVGIQGGSKLTDLFGDIGQLSNIISATLGLDSKAVGARSELPLEQQIKVNEWRFTKTRSDHAKERSSAMKRTPDPGSLGSLFGIDLDSISLFPGQTSQPRDQLQNKYGPRTAGMEPYSSSDGRDAVEAFAGRVFPFEITNLAKVGTYQQYPNRPPNPGVKKGAQATEIFPAYIRALNEQFNTQWSQRAYFGRSEDVYIYNGANRSFNLDITLFATNDAPPKEFNQPTFIPGVIGPVIQFEDGGYPIPVSNFVPSSLGPVLGAEEFPALMDNNISKTDLWKKMSFLESLCYPAYDSEGRYSRSPFCRITLGSLWENQLCIIQSVNIAYDPMVWDLNGKHFTPMFANITIAGILIHDTSPGTLDDGTFGYKDADGKIRYIHRSDFE
jgi:hypothetical protein